MAKSPETTVLTARAKVFVQFERQELVEVGELEVAIPIVLDYTRREDASND